MASLAQGTSKIVFGGSSLSIESKISILDLATHQVPARPVSQGSYSPRSSPDGRYISVLLSDDTRLLLLDFRSQSWTAPEKRAAGWPHFSKDGKYLYVLSGRGASAVLKIRLSDAKTERVADMRNLVHTGHYSDSPMTLGPDDSLLLFRNAGTADVFALDWEEP